MYKSFLFDKIYIFFFNKLPLHFFVFFFYNTPCCMYHVITIYISLLYYDILIICYETMYFYDIFVTTLYVSCFTYYSTTLITTFDLAIYRHYFNTYVMTACPSAGHQWLLLFIFILLVGIRMDFDAMADNWCNPSRQINIYKCSHALTWNLNFPTFKKIDCCFPFLFFWLVCNGWQLL